MRLYEFANPIITRLVAISDQLKNDLEQKEVGVEMSTDQLLDYLASYDIVVDKQDLYNMIKKPPLNNVISNIQGDSVVFKGYEDSDNFEPTGDSEKVVAKMADKANKLK